MFGAHLSICGKMIFGQVYTISQGEGGEQGDTLMPLLFALGQHGSLETTARTLCEVSFMFAFLDDIFFFFFITAPNRVGAICATLQEALWPHARIAVHLGKTKVEASGWKNAQFSREWPAKQTGLPASGGDLKFLKVLGLRFGIHSTCARQPGQLFSALCGTTKTLNFSRTHDFQMRQCHSAS